jgi:hypothetical protein
LNLSSMYFKNLHSNHQPHFNYFCHHHALTDTYYLSLYGCFPILNMWQICYGSYHLFAFLLFSIWMKLYQLNYVLNHHLFNHNHLLSHLIFIFSFLIFCASFKILKMLTFPLLSFHLLILINLMAAFRLLNWKFNHHYFHFLLLFYYHS